MGKLDINLQSKKKNRCAFPEGDTAVNMLSVNLLAISMLTVSHNRCS